MGSKISPKFRGDLSHDASMVAWHIYLNENRKINHSCRQIYQSHGWYGMGVFVETDLTYTYPLVQKDGPPPPQNTFFYIFRWFLYIFIVFHSTKTPMYPFLR